MYCQLPSTLIGISAVAVALGLLHPLLIVVAVAVGGAAGDEPLPDRLEGGRRRDIEADVVEVPSGE